MKTTIEQMSAMKIHSKEWFKAAFEGEAWPEEIKQASIRICCAYGIHGQCDPAYIANVITAEINKTNVAPFNQRFWKEWN